MSWLVVKVLLLCGQCALQAPDAVSQYLSFHSLLPILGQKDWLIGFNKLRHYPIVAPLHRPINSSQSLSLSPCPHHQTEHKEVRSCGSSFSLMLMHILSLLHTNVSWPRLAVCLSLDLHLLSGYWPQFNLTRVTANQGTDIIFIHRNPIFKTVNDNSASITRTMF